MAKAKTTKKKTPKKKPDAFSAASKKKQAQIKKDLKATGKIKTGRAFGLNPRQEFFCQLYASTEQFFGNGTKAYMEAYEVKGGLLAYNSAKQCAYRLLTNVDILKYVDYLLELKGLNNSYVDKQLEFLISQHGDYKTKLGAIREYNVLKKRTTKKEFDFTSGGEVITGMVIKPEK